LPLASNVARRMHILAPKVRGGLRQRAEAMPGGHVCRRPILLRCRVYKVVIGSIPSSPHIFWTPWKKYVRFWKHVVEEEIFCYEGSLYSCEQHSWYVNLCNSSIDIIIRTNWACLLNKDCRILHTVVTHYTAFVVQERHFRDLRSVKIDNHQSNQCYSVDQLCCRCRSMPVGGPTFTRWEAVEW
jgi:hypothetical protein